MMMLMTTKTISQLSPLWGEVLPVKHEDGLLSLLLSQDNIMAAQAIP
jgi:hypothetical protein